MSIFVTAPEINNDDCTGCGECVPACPSEALVLVENKVTLLPDIDCSYCGECEEVCPTGAIACPYEVTFAEENDA